MRRAYPPGMAASAPLAGSLLSVALLLATPARPREPASPTDDHFAAAERAHYGALCRTRKDLDSCSDAVRWNPGDPVLVVALADALVRAGRLPEAIRDYRRAAALEPGVHGLDAKISEAEAKLAARRRPKIPAADHASADKAPLRRYSNFEPEAQSH